MASVAELSRQVDQERRELGRNLSELKDRAESALDWREQVQKHPALAAAAALGTGMLLAQLGNGSRGRGSSMRSGPVTPISPDVVRDPGVLDHVGDALKATAGTVVAGMLSEWIPGFREEHERRRSELRR